MINLKKKLVNKEITFGGWLQIGDSTVAEIMAQAGFEWLTVDLEHSVISLKDAQTLFQVMQSKDIVGLARLSSNDPVQIKRLLDSGCMGIIVPNVNNKSQAQAAVCAAKYPPAGYRGTGIARAQKYGADFKNYFSWANDNIVVIAQIEHKEAVENIEDIIATDIDGIIIGPYDISASYGVAGEFNHPDVVKGINRIKDVVKASSKSLGTHVVYPDLKEVSLKIEDGFNFIAYSTDSIILQSYTRSDVNSLKELINRKVYPVRNH